MSTPMDDGGPPPPPGGGGGGSGGSGGGSGGGGIPKGHQPGDLWLQILQDTNPVMVDLLLLGATNPALYYQLESKANSGVPPVGGWMPGELKSGVSGTNGLWFSPVSCISPPNNFFRAVSGANEAYLSADCSLQPGLSCTAIRPDARGNHGMSQTNYVNLIQSAATNVTVYYSMTGTASNGVDYASLPGYVVVSAYTLTAQVIVEPLYRTNMGFDPLAVFTLEPTPGCVVDPNRAAITVPIMDYFTNNIFSIVASPTQVVDVDYFTRSNCLFLSLDYPYGTSGNFALLATNGTWTNWSGVSGLGGEVNVATVKVTAGGFTNGDAYFIQEGTGVIGWVSADGTAFNPNWLTLPRETDSQETSDLYLDQTGLWGNALLAVTSRPSANQSGIWRITAQTNATLVASNLPSPHMEGLLTLPNDPRYGPWAGKLLAGDEMTNTLYTIGTNGAVQAWNLGAPGLGVAGQTFLIVPTNQNLYCQDSIDLGSDPSYIRKLSTNFFASHGGDILTVQCPEFAGGGGDFWLPMVWLLRWNGTGFDTWCLSLCDLESPPFNFTPGFGLVEKGVFAPFDLPPTQ